MTIKQKQWQLYYLGYYGSSPRDIDGIWGEKSKAATLAFQKDFGIKADGIFGPSTEDKTKEVIDAIQDVITRYAAAPLVNDCFAGAMTMAATKLFQKAHGLPQTGIADKQTRDAVADNAPAPDPTEDAEGGDFWDDIEFFDREEFKCKCGGRYCKGYPTEMQETVVKLADRARKHFNAPATVVSGLRCKVHNANCGGVANSQHMYGEAIDLRIKGVSGDKLLAYMKQQPEVRYTYKINSTNVHFDIPKGKR